ncbi:MAG TPA: J domain-containing protein [Candidatus Hydrogenedentes bacterium]|nr:J domain-containing protein [Candidatus Hydrogenedentota bacterium]HOJ67509.1 J domain-containing protein [Candidatus Hydrogenedentota bacterium]HOK90006.1 J domain-containing protein [Candidatus Hydrogenedentota bacterium]
MAGLQEIFVVILIAALLHATGLTPILARLWRMLQEDLRTAAGFTDKGQRFADAGERAFGAPHPADLELCYRLLGISSSATWEEIERAYRKKAKIHHPDHGGDEDAMRALNEAYQALKRARGRKT